MTTEITETERPDLSPRSFAHDFEKGAINAIKINWPTVIIYGCYFHLAQNLFKQVQKKSLVYVKNIDFRISFKKLKSIIFVPESDVISVFKTFSCTTTAQFFPILGMRTVPFFPIKIWNCNQRVSDNHARTNNSLESWHKQFELDVGKHPTTNKLVEQFRIEQKNTEILIEQLKAGDVYKKKITRRKGLLD